MGTLLGGAALLAVFLVIECRVAHPLVPLGVFRLRSVAAANGIAVTIGAALFGMFFFLSLYLQQVNEYSPLKAGFAFLPAALATLIGSIAGTRIVTRLGTRRQLVIGPLTTAAAVAWLAQLSAGDGYLVHVFGPLMLAGIGLGLSFVPMTIAATADVPTHQAGLASGLLNTTRQVGGAIGLAVMATIAGRAATPTAGYDHAFWISAAALTIGAAIAFTLPGMPKPERHGTSSGEIAEPVVLVEA